MRVALYARKSTLQERADPEAKSVATQLANARAYAAARGWEVAEEHVYTDDAVSGAEVKKLVNRQRLLDTLPTRPPFQAIVMRDESRFSRLDGDQAVAELKAIARAGFEVHFYQDGSQFTYGDFGQNIYAFVKAELNAEYRRSASRNTHETHVRMAKLGYTVGGRCFGYHNVCSVCAQIIPPGKMRCCREGHTDKRINDAHAAVIHRIFALRADGMGYTRIVKQLNAEGAPTPIGRKDRPCAWSPGSVREVLHRDLYRGVVVYNKTRRRAPDGTLTFAERAAAEHVHLTRNDLRIVSDDEWRSAQARMAEQHAKLQKAGFTTRGRRRKDADSPYLLSGFLRCAECGGSMGVIDKRAYQCTAYHKRGTTVCTNALRKPIAALEAAIREKLTREVLRPAVLDSVVNGLLARLAPRTLAKDLARRQQALSKLNAEISRITEAIALGNGSLPPLVAALQERQTKHAELVAEIDARATIDATRYNRSDILQRAQRRFAEWRAAVEGRAVPKTRTFLRESLNGPIVLTADGGTYRFAGELAVGKLFAGEVGLATYVARPGGLDKSCLIPFSGIAA